MNKLSGWLEKTLMPIAAVIGGQRHLGALRDGFIATLGVNMVGAMAVLFNNIIFTSGSLAGKKLNESAGYAESVQPIFDKYVIPVMGRVWWATLAIIAIFLVVSISYSLAKSYEVDGIAAAITGIASYFAILAEAGPRVGGLTISEAGTVAFLDANGAVVEVAAEALNGATQATIGTWGQIPVGNFGSTAMFASIIVAMVGTQLFVAITKAGWTFKMPEQVPPAVSKAFSAIIPSTITILLFSIIGVVFTNFVEIPFLDIVNKFIQEPLVKLGQSPITYIGLVMFSQLLWFFGLHGSNIIDPAMNSMYRPPLLENMEAFQNGLGQEAMQTLTRNFVDVYAQPGGSGATLALLVAIFFFAKRQEQRELFKLAIAPGLFQINEPVIFGMPLVLNPIMFIPFIFTPAICLTIAYVFTEIIPFANKICVETPWTTPPILSAFLATGGDIKAALLAAALFALSVLIYTPFIIASNREEV
ncbi:PTS transporter subunit EIIC [uncultured Clostridium sp.]|jgi:PTS system cellobiose-specific IIC component|uniref:PTS sugar transporter subunit IIC n=1 Tax=uncultured Clostridium sp. TaxID=59620 RepID=UPI00262DBAFA|nr:PTS transporter subunit EIIC [uncultured Clostridium sp.]